MVCLTSYALLLSASAGLLATANNKPDLILKLEVKHQVASRLSNIHISNLDDKGQTEIRKLRITFGSCESRSVQDAHHVVADIDVLPLTRPSRLVWVLPPQLESDGCLSAWDASGVLRGQSERQKVAVSDLKRRARPSPITMDAGNGIDNLGPWFDGVALLENKQPDVVDVETAKSKSVAIVGAGMSGLMTYLVLSQAGLTNISIIESTNRLGGRVRTEYLSGGPFDYSYQEMGPMRFPATFTDWVSNQTVNISDHQLVFSLAAEMNRLNGGDKNLSVDFIPWIQWNSNGLVYKRGFKLNTGLPPTVADIAANSSLDPQLPPDQDLLDLQTNLAPFLTNFTMGLEMAQNMFQAHREWIDHGLGGLGGDVWSEFAFMYNYLNATLNSTYMLSPQVADSFWEQLTSRMYFAASSFRTIDGGLNRLPESFHPHVDNITTLNRKIERITLSENSTKINLHWRDNFTSSTWHSSAHDYAVISAPFTIVRKWRLPPLPATISNAINNLRYMSACKVALEFKTRFWEHYSEPILGGCSTTTDIAGIGEICYPSYNINGTGPATVLASYNAGAWGERWIGISEEEHVQYVLDTFAEIHGDELVREQYTGKYNRKCWLLDEAGGWAHPSVGQHQLYLPEFFKTYNGMIFVGEHTSFTHAWIASALESGIRGAVQLLLELGLVDEAKEAVQKWMARWIRI
ncbi:L-amino-acid oxidase [Rhypophila decipiens]|uniref:L-amino-acid oxidase n=1 Tax=Rhypophila decipiens TaxID=261697 RepID=A0AAN7BAK9_9PEZI|nr:L-amino-acid oxidase [Rhypophila decipiens]